MLLDMPSLCNKQNLYEYPSATILPLAYWYGLCIVIICRLCFLLNSPSENYMQQNKLSQGIVTELHQQFYTITI